DQRALVLHATPDEASNNFAEDVRLEFAGADVIEKKERLGPEDGDIIDAMIDEVLADGVVTIEGERNFQFCADSVDAGDEHGLLEAARIEREEPTEAADLAEDFRAMRG